MYPQRTPRLELRQATSAAQNGATALVPADGQTLPPAMILQPRRGSAGPATSGTPRPFCPFGASGTPCFFCHRGTEIAGLRLRRLRRECRASRNSRQIPARPCRVGAHHASATAQHVGAASGEIHLRVCRRRNHSLHPGLQRTRRRSTPSMAASRSSSSRLFR